MKREKRSNNGRLVLTDFRKLNPKNFLACENLTRKQLRDQIALCSCEGIVYVNSKFKESEIIFGIFQNFDDWSTAAQNMNNEERIFSLSMLLASTELSRRRIEREYYGKILTFPC